MFLALPPKQNIGLYYPSINDIAGEIAVFLLANMWGAHCNKTARIVLSSVRVLKND